MSEPFISPCLCASLMPDKMEHTDENIFSQMKLMRYPVVATVKKDGVRGIRIDKTLKSRTRKLIPNVSIRERAKELPGGFDMELWTPMLEYNDIQSIVMSEEHERSDMIEFHMIDWFGKPWGYEERMKCIAQWDFLHPHEKVIMPDYWICDSANELMKVFLDVEHEKGEGICFRLPDSPYKQGYSTLKEQYLVKLARYIYEEAVISGFEEQYCNCNPDKRNALGKMARSKSDANMIPKNTLGALVCHLTNGVVVRVATGMTDKLRQEIWDNKEKYICRTITLKHKPHGALLRPRSPVFVGFREKGF